MKMEAQRKEGQRAGTEWYNVPALTGLHNTLKERDEYRIPVLACLLKL